ncbi:MAG: hypothetical protein ABEJ84_00940 [Halodesulfurarchaeum sp.]
MELSGDELAGIVDQFGALSPAELRRAIRETAFRAGVDLEESTIDDWIDGAEADFSLLTVDLDGEALVVPGPRAFPDAPEAASDLPHVMDVDRRSVPVDALESGLRNRLAAATAELEEGATAIEKRLEEREKAGTGIEDGPGGIEESDRARELIDVTYDAEAWADIDLGDVRDRLSGLAEQES